MKTLSRSTVWWLLAAPLAALAHGSAHEHGAATLDMRTFRAGAAQADETERDGGGQEGKAVEANGQRRAKLCGNDARQEGAEDECQRVGGLQAAVGVDDLVPFDQVSDSGDVGHAEEHGQR